MIVGSISVLDSGVAASEPKPDQAVASEVTFEADVRPILKEHCFHCHGEGEELAGGLDLRLRKLIARGGDSGSSLDLQNPLESHLWQRIAADEMPPEDASKRPTAEQRQTLMDWLKAGAPVVGPEPDSLAPGLHISQADRAFWSFQPIRSVRVPAVKNSARMATAIDGFLLRRLEQQKRTFAPRAQREVLIRRATLDLWGLPPSYEMVEAFLADSRPDAYERLIDQLLNSPHYGERWGQVWLDIAGYADSEGVTDSDAVRPHAYRYRDYVIDALNRDVPYDQFLIEQLAGDELVELDGDYNAEEIRLLTATGFLRTAPDGTGSGDNSAASRHETVHNTVEIVSSSILGLTVACARCHHHRYDPISQEDYYALRAIFEPAFDVPHWKSPQQRLVSLYTDRDRQQAAAIEAEAKKLDQARLAKQRELIEATFEKQLAKLPEEIRAAIREARELPEKERSAEQAKLLRDHPSVNVTAGSLYLYDKKAADELKADAERASQLRGTKPQEQFLRALVEPRGQACPESFVFARGDHEQTLQAVEPAELRILDPDGTSGIPSNQAELPTSGRRLAYARWLVSGRHPLVARVMVNRIWLEHFGQGLVKTPGDFGFLGSPPSHPDLLDWLASEFMQRGWSVKQLHRLIMRSEAYQQSARVRPDGDAENRWLGRRVPRRLSAEALRDSLLCISGQLLPQMAGPSVPVMADSVGQFVVGIENLNAGRPQGVVDMKGQQFRRSIYVQARRSRPLASLDTFDRPAMTPNCLKRSSTTVSTQSLWLMNSAQIVELSRRFAQRVVGRAGFEHAAQVEWAWKLALGRPPTASEASRAATFLSEQAADYAANAPPAAKAAEKAAQEPSRELTDLCHALLCSNEFLYVE